MKVEEWQGLMDMIGDLQTRVDLLENKAHKIPGRGAAETKRLRALAVRLNQQLDGDKSETARKLQRRRWVREFAAAALPTAMLQHSTTDEAVAAAGDAGLRLWALTKGMLDEMDRADDEREKPQTTK